MYDIDYDFIQDTINQTVIIIILKQNIVPFLIHKKLYKTLYK